jgi:hypothetical protein
MLNLNTTYPISTDGPYYALPVLVDLNWLGQTMTQDNGGIILSRSSSVTFNDDREVML